MKKILAALAVSALMFTGACGGSSDDKPTVTKTVTATPTPSESNTPDGDDLFGDDTTNPNNVSDNEFGSFIRNNTNAFDSMSNSKIANLGKQVCKQWKVGRSLQDVALDFIDNGYDAKDSGYLVGAATAAYCPQYKNKLSDEGNKLQGGNNV